MTTFWERPARLDDPMLSLDNVYSQLFFLKAELWLLSQFLVITYLLVVLRLLAHAARTFYKPKSNINYSLRSANGSDTQRIHRERQYRENTTAK